MSVEDEISRISTNAAGKRLKDRINLYGRGLLAKLKQAEFCLDSLRSLAAGPIDTTATGDVLDQHEKAEFYCDYFWSLLYSVLDILAQIINQHSHLGFDERNVSFNAVQSHLEANNPTTQVTVLLIQLKDSNTYGNILNYRNCSNHRRPICIEHKTITTTHTAAYTTTSPVQETKRLICENPLDLRPRFTQERDLVHYSENSLNLLKDKIERILRELS